MMTFNCGKILHGPLRRSSKPLPKGEEEKVAGVWGLQAAVVTSHLQAFILLLRPKGEMSQLASG